jgi:AraC-like DNA-binding protein
MHSKMDIVIDHQIMDISKDQMEILCGEVTFDSQLQCVGKHFHEYYEFVYLLDGLISCTIEDTTLEITPGSTVIIHPNCIHSFGNLFSDNSKVMFLLFSPSILNMDNSKSTYSRYLKMFTGDVSYTSSYLFSPYKKQEDIATILKNINHEYRTREAGYEFQLRGFVYQLLGCIQYSGIEIINKNDDTHFDEIKNLCHYIESNISMDFTLASVAKSMNYSKEHFSRLFAKVVGENFKKYVDYVKINEAERLILYKKSSVQEAAKNAGYSSSYSFSRAFKRIKGYSPSQTSSNNTDSCED